MNDGVALIAASHPVPKGWERVRISAKGFWRTLTWPIRKYYVTEIVEIELKPATRPLSGLITSKPITSKP